MMAQLLCLWSVFVFMNIVVMNVVGQKVCDQAEECIFESMSRTSTIGSFQCHGYRSCYEAIQISAVPSSNADIEIYCRGSYSCYGAELLNMDTGSSSSEMDCRGLFSCANVASMYMDAGDINCDAEQSCRWVTSMEMDGSDGILTCAGDESCADIESCDTRYINNMYGNLAGMNSIFKSGDSAVLYRFYGADSGYNAKLLCGDADTCSIVCTGNACNYLNVTCAAGADCTLSFDCSSAQYSSNCPYGYVLPSEIIDSFPSLIDVSMSTWENSYWPCYSDLTGAINCDDYQECESETILNTTNAPICGTAYSGIESIVDTLITATLSTSDETSDDEYYQYWTENSAVRCDGSISCRDSNIIANNGHVYLSGIRSAEATSTDNSYYIKTNDKDLYDIFCNGWMSCVYRDISNANNLYCNGEIACTDIYAHDIHDIYAYGYQALKIDSSVTIQDIDNLYCGASESCYGVTVSNVDDSVFGNSYMALYQSTITNVNQNVIGAGYQAAYQSTITNATNVYCIGEESCLGSTIRGIGNKLYVDGHNAISQGVIISETSYFNGGASSTLTIYINGTTDEASTSIYIYCNASDTCNIKCGTSDACSRVSLSCHDNCWVDCDETGGVNCPYEGIYWLMNWPTNEPTDIPSNEPSTAMPSLTPSYEPSMSTTMMTTRMMTTSNENDNDQSTMQAMDTTVATTVVPSKQPSKEPSIQPSIEPSIQPSIEPSKSPTKSPSSSSSGSSSSSSSSSSSDGLSDSAAISITAIVICGVVVMVLMVLLYLYFNQNKKNQNESLMNQNIEMNGVNTAAAGDGAPDTARSQSGSIGASVVAIGNETNDPLNES